MPEDSAHAHWLGCHTPTLGLKFKDRKTTEFSHSSVSVQCWTTEKGRKGKAWGKLLLSQKKSELPNPRFQASFTGFQPLLKLKLG